MLQLAQDIFKAFQDRLRLTLHAAVDLSESVGMPNVVTSVFQGLERLTGPGNDGATPARVVERPEVRDPQGVPLTDEAPSVVSEKARPTKKRHTGSARDLPEGVRPLKVEDAVNGSTYLARIIWSLGVAELEGTGALRPADIARMIMSRSPVSLEPPNVARYIRRSKPSSITVDHTEGSSQFYRLNEEGHELFNEKFRVG